MAVIGIDLGTTNSLAAVWQQGRSRLIPNALGDVLTPSAVSIDEDGTVLVGEAARQRLVSHPERSAAAFKRAMGTNQTYSLAGRTFTPEELSALVLRQLKQDAEAFLGEPVEEAVVSVPAYFNDRQRAATKRAGQLAGLRVERLVNEPSAAALSCYKPDEGEASFLVFDFGGGTLDVSVVECFDNVVNILAVSGDNALGGNDFDETIAHLFCVENGLDYRGLDRAAKAILLEQAEKCKQALTENPMAVMIVDSPGVKGALSLTGKKLVEHSQKLLERMRTPVARALRDSGLGRGELAGVIPVGGSCKMPLVRQYLAHLLGQRPKQNAQPDTVVALGAGMYAAMKAREANLRDMILTDICPFTLGTNIINRADPARDLMAPIIKRNSALPVSRVQRFCTVSEGQELVEIEVYQGEGMHCDENLKLGKLSVPVPPAKAGQESVDVRFTYDINGILEVEVRSVSTKETVSALLLGQGSGMTEEQARLRMQELADLKIPPRERAANRLLLARAQRLFAETTGPRHNAAVRVLLALDKAIAQQTPEMEMARLRRKIGSLLDDLERAGEEELSGFFADEPEDDLPEGWEGEED